jgi:hypothetical protein
MSLDEVEKLMDDTAEAIAYQEQISRALSGKITEDDEEDLVKELEGLCDEQVMIFIELEMMVFRRSKKAKYMNCQMFLLMSQNWKGHKHQLQISPVKSLEH